MTSRATWDSSQDNMCRITTAPREAGAPRKDTWTPLHGCPSPMAARPSPGRLRPPASPALACITLALLLCSLVQLAVASLQLPASSSTTARLTPRLQDESQAFTHHAFLGNTAVPPPHEAPTGRSVSAAGEGREDPPEGQNLPAAVTATPTNEAPLSSLEKDAPHAPARATRSITAIQRVEMHGPPMTTRKTMFVEVVVLADNSLYKKYSTQGGALKRVTQVLSVANRVLGGVGVVLVPVDVEVWDRGDKFQVTSRLETNVDRLQKHRLRLLRNRHNDHTLLLTGKQMRGEELHGSPLRGMCRAKQSVSVVQDEGEGPGVTGVALARQVGHSLGMEADAEDPNHACRCDASTCVMSRHFRNASTPGLAWSACSRQSLDSALETLALDCLTNVPTRMYPSSSCGDGVVDDGEQCDCGPEEFCDNPCCVAATCRLAVNASCASGSCCDIQKCQPKSPGTVCRAAVKECDLPEFCSGHSEYCPKDVTKADGTPCGEGHCFRGECGNREEQCQRLWGPSASAASPDCYAKLNIRGNHAGNCGMQRGVLRRCRKQEALCGTLHCIAPALPSHLLQEHRNGSGRAGPHQCHFISGSDKYPTHHWLTPNGAPCGPGKMCINQRCEEVPGMTGECLAGCSGNGVCNSLGHCHCNAGFSPPSCSLPGLGGSLDSNVMADVSDSWLLITFAWVVVVLLVSLMAVTCCSWGCFKGWYKKKGRDSISQTLPCCAACLDRCCCPVMTKAVRWMLTVGSPPEKIQRNRNIEVAEEANEHMLCSVDVDVKGTSQTNSWGVASDKLVTEVVTITPKDSPDFRRKVKLSSDSPVLHYRSEENLERPTYLQSISMDSGCVSDTDEDSTGTRTSLQLSMSSLLNTLMKFGDKKPKTMPENENRLSRTFGSQKSIPLSRFVVDPLVGRQSFRQGTPPSEHIRPTYSRSFSTDVVSSRRNRKEGTPPPPPPSSLKPNKSEENLSKASEMPNRDSPPYRKPSPPSKAPTPPKKYINKDSDREASPTIPSKGPSPPPTKKKPLPPPPKVPPVKGNSPPKMGSQRYHEGKGPGKPSPANGTSRPSPPKTSSGSQGSPVGTAASNKVTQMTRKFEAA